MIAEVRRGLVERIDRKFYYGWAVVGVGSLGIFTSGPGQSHTISVFYAPISRDLGISSTDVSSAYGMATLVAAFVLPQMGKLVDRFGPTKALTAIVALLGLACALFGAVSGFLWLALGFGLLRFLGQGSLMLGCANLISRWFSRRRGFAMSLMALGFALSLAVHPPLAQYLVAEIGWRQAWVVLGLLTWLFMIPVIIVFVHDKPADAGVQPPDGELAQPTSQSSDAPPRASGLTLREALGTVSFYVLGLGMFAIAMLVTALHVHHINLLSNRGLSPEAAAWAFTITAVVMATMMPLVGRLFDRMRTRLVIALALAVTALSLVGMTFVQDTLTAAVYAAVFGLNNAFSMTMFGYVWPRYFGQRDIGRIQGTGQMIGVVGASFGPLPIAYAFDNFGDATEMLWMLALFSFVSALITVALLRTHHSIREFAHLE